METNNQNEKQKTGLTRTVRIRMSEAAYQELLAISKARGSKLSRVIRAKLNLPHPA